MSTIKNKVFNFVIEDTKRNINNESFDFENLNATSIGIDLDIDRSNVSRILNSLHNENKLIKQKGRPTLYFSREVFIEEYPYLSLPLTLELDDDIKNYINFSTYNLKPQREQAYNFIDYSFNEDLFLNYQKLFPVFLLPSNESKIVTIQGEIGTGKKFLVEKAIEQGKKSGVINFNANIFYLSHISKNYTSQDFFHILKQEEYPPILCIEFSHGNNDLIFKYIQIIESLYLNRIKDLPILIFCINESIDNNNYKKITPYHINVPTFSNLNLRAQIYIILLIVKKEAVRLKKNIIISKEGLLNIITREYEHNIRNLKMELLHKISSLLFKQTGNAQEIYINELIEDSDLKPINFSTKDQSIWNNLPQSILLTTDKSQDLQNILIEKVKPKKQRREQNNIHDLIISLPLCTNFESYNSIIMDRVSNILFDTNLNHDPGLIFGLANTIDSLYHNKIQLENYKLDHLAFKTSHNQGILNRISRALSNKEFNKEEKIFIQNILHEAFQSIKNTKIPVLIVSDSHQSDLNYALYFNKLSKNRIFHVLNSSDPFYQPNTDLETKVELISKRTQEINRGHGILLVNNLDSHDNLYKRLLLELRNQAFPINFPSVELMLSILEISDKMKKNIFSLSPALIKVRKEKKSYFSNTTLIDSREQINTFTSPAIDIFQNINVNVVTRELYNILNELSFNIGFPLTNDLIFDFLFMGNAITDKKQNKHFINHPADIDIKSVNTKNSIFQIISKKIENSSILNQYNYNNIEIDCLFYTLNNYIK